MSRGLTLGFDQSPLSLNAARVLFSAPLVPIGFSAPPPTANTKFVSGDWAQSQNINGSPAPAGNGRNAAEIQLLPAHPALGYKAWYSWRGLEKFQGDAATFQQTFVADLNQLQAIVPGTLMQAMIAAGSNVPGGSLTPTQAIATTFKQGIPDYVYNCGGSLTVPNFYGSSQTTTYSLGQQQNGQYGFALSGWNIVAPGTYDEIFAAFWDPAVARAFANYLQLFLTTPFKVTAGPYAGQTFTYDTCPLCPKLVWNDEYSLNVNQGGFNPPASTNPSNQPTTTNYFNGNLTICNAISQAAPHTLFDIGYSWGFVGTNGGDSSSTMVSRMPQLAAIPRLCFSGPDTFAAGFSSAGPQSTFGQQGYIGIQSPTAGNAATLQPADPTKAFYGTPSLNTAQVQSPDFGSKLISGHGTDTAATINDIIATAAIMHSFERSWSMGGFQLKPAIMWPLIQTTFKAAPAPNWILDPVAQSANVGRTNIQLNWVARPYVTGYLISRATNPGMSGAITFSTILNAFNDTGLTPSTNYWYTIQATFGTQKSPGNHIYQQVTNP